MRKVYNFSAGPAMQPEDVLLQAQAEFLDWRGTGMSIMELGHRGAEFQAVAEESERDFREIMEIPKNYHVLFLAGGASTQFAMVPINLFAQKPTADYIDTGIWSKKAIAEAKRYGDVNIVTKLEEKNGLMHIPHPDKWALNPDAAYMHYTPNETIEGVEFQYVPDTGKVPLVADMTSMILSRPIDVSKYGIIYAGAQKNMGIAGLNVVIIRDDLIKDPLPFTTTLYSYKLQVEHRSFYNTPPTFAWYFAGLIFAWIKKQGGVKKLAEIAERRAKKVYTVIDENRNFYFNPIYPDCRSLLNIPFSLRDDKLTATFLDEAKSRGLTNLKGHKSVGGVRASIYNAMPEQGVDALVDFMKEFSKKYG